MAGVYVHIPFCKKRCLYCDFFSTTLLERRAEYIAALLEEIRARKHELDDIRTVYLGGGTPSVLDVADIQQILDTIGTERAEEITMELNPGDATPAYLAAIRAAGINRLSIGVQSLDDRLLQLIGRRHTAAQAIDTVRWAQTAGFDNISIDLMYALPTQTLDQWKTDIQRALDLGVQHISSYGLMYEEGTALTKMRDAGAIEAIDEDTENEMYDVLCEQLKKAGFVHYEVSNFALPGYEAKHNSSYWDGTPYIGVGAGAHSYLPPVRSWNPDDLDAYINGIMAHNLLRESETLTEKDRYNESIMLGLRTRQGVNEELTRRYRDVIETSTRFLNDGSLQKTPEGRIAATQKGLHVLNRIIEALMIE